jgi:Secretion system C-terminal sorting domain
LLPLTSGAVSYQWSSPISLTYGNPALVSPNTTVTYTLIGTDANGCQGSTTYQLNVSECVGLKDVSTTASGIRLYPNPSKGEFIVEIQDKLVHTIEVTDLSGRLLYTTTSKNEKISLDLTQFANGVYYVKVSSENHQEVIKVVKQ